MKKILILILGFSMTVPMAASAHPGRTDENGGHYCYTKCEEWGLTYGQYHMHGTPSPVRTESRSSARSRSR